jgi:hypothetical protein
MGKPRFKGALVGCIRRGVMEEQGGKATAQHKKLGGRSAHFDPGLGQRYGVLYNTVHSKLFVSRRPSCVLRSPQIATNPESTVSTNHFAARQVGRERYQLPG